MKVVAINGSPRKDGAGVDIGAYEYLIPLPPKNPLPPVDPAAVPKDTTEWVSDDQLLFNSTYTGRVPLVMPEGMQVRFRRVAKSIPF